MRTRRVVTKPTIRVLLAGALLSSTASAAPLQRSADAGDLNTLEITASAVSLDCVDYCIVGSCIKLQCSLLGGCKIKVYPKVRHYNPDFVVAAYNEVGDNPWREMQALLNLPQEVTLAALIGALTNVPPGGGSLGPGNTLQDIQFKEVDVIGHPLAGANQQLVSDVANTVAGADAGVFAGQVCPTRVTPMVPYFQSSLDALAWRFPTADLLEPAAWVPGRREIGTWPRNTWGHVYPRSGFVAAVPDPKAAAVAAQRAVDIVSRDAQPHLYLRAGGPAATENDGSVRWQMLRPVPSRRCEVFGSADELHTLTGWSSAKVAPRGAYAWTAWRRYTCCPGRGTTLSEVDLPPICLQPPAKAPSRATDQ